MDRMQKQSILIVLSSIEQQISALRNLVMIGGNDEVTHKVRKHQAAAQSAMGYTSDDEDKSIEEALKHTADDVKENFLQELAAEAQRGLNG